MTIIFAGRGFSTAPDMQPALNALANAMAAAILQSYPQGMK